MSEEEKKLLSEELKLPLIRLLEDKPSEFLSDLGTIDLVAF